MSYTPINWQTGDTITAEKLNKMDNGWGVTPGERTTICEETVETVGGGPAFGIFAYSTEITAQNIIVTLNGIEYECEYQASIPGYGDTNFVDPPFVIDYYDGDNEIGTPTAGTYSVKIEAVTPSTVEVSQNFISAVAMVAEVGKTTFQEIDDALALGRIVIIIAASEYGAGVQFVCYTDKTGTPLEVGAISGNTTGVTMQVYTASSATSPIEPY